MSISPGDKLPEVTLTHMTDDGPKPIGTRELFSGKKVVVFAVPGAFTPTCSAAHLPGFVAMADKIKAKGVDDIVCLSVNDAFVLDAWGKAQNAEEIHMVADGAAALTKALGLDLDLSERGLGVRSKRYSMIVEDGTVTDLAVEEAPPKLEVSSAQAVLAKL